MVKYEQKKSPLIQQILWTHLNYYSQSLLIVQFSRKLLLNAGFDIDLIKYIFQISF